MTEGAPLQVQAASSFAACIHPHMAGDGTPIIQKPSPIDAKADVYRQLEEKILAKPLADIIHRTGRLMEVAGAEHADKAIT